MAVLPGKRRQHAGTHGERWRCLLRVACQTMLWLHTVSTEPATTNSPGSRPRAAGLHAICIAARYLRSMAENTDMAIYDQLASSI